MKKNAGKIVQTASGLGILRNNTSLVNGKHVVEIVQEKTFAPVLMDGKQLKILVAPDKLTVIGYVD